MSHYYQIGFLLLFVIIERAVIRWKLFVPDARVNCTKQSRYEAFLYCSYD